MLAQRDDLALYEAVRSLSDHDLTGLQTLLTALSFGQENCDRLDTGDSLFNRVARDLSVDMHNHWHPDASFFSKRTRDQLVSIAIDCGYAEGKGQVSSYKKNDLVNCLIRHFQSAKAAAAPTPAQCNISRFRAGSYFPADDVLQHLLVERDRRPSSSAADSLPRAASAVSSPRHQPAILLAPVVIRCFADRPATDLFDRRSFFALP
jgi:hypothetical protein